MATLVEELVHYLSNVRFLEKDTLEARDILQAELKTESGSRILNKINTMDYHSNFHGLESNKYKFKELMSLFDQANKIAFQKEKLEELAEDPFAIKDPGTKSILRALIDSIVLEGCEMLLDDQGLIRQDVLSFLGIKAEEDKLNQSNDLLRSFVQHMTEEIFTAWYKDNVGQAVVSNQSMISKMTKEESKKNEEANIKTQIYSKTENFCKRYYENKDYLQSQVDNHRFSLACNIPAKCASELKAISMKTAPDIFKKKLTEFMLADFHKSTLLTIKDKMEFWIDVISFSAGNGDQNSLEVFLDVCKSEPAWLDQLSSTKLTQHVSCQSLLTYYNKGWIAFDSKSSIEKQETKLDEAVLLKPVNTWINARNNNEIIESVLQQYHRGIGKNDLPNGVKKVEFPESDKTLKEEEKTTLEALEKIKFGDTLLKSTEEFLADLTEEVGKEGRLAAVVANVVNLEKNGRAKQTRSASLFSPKQVSPSASAVNTPTHGKKTSG